jgi:hypothetical protein
LTSNVVLIRHLQCVIVATLPSVEVFLERPGVLSALNTFVLTPIRTRLAARVRANVKKALAAAADDEEEYVVL